MNEEVDPPADPCVELNFVFARSLPTALDTLMSEDDENGGFRFKAGDDEDDISARDCFMGTSESVRCIHGGFDADADVI